MKKRQIERINSFNNIINGYKYLLKKGMGDREIIEKCVSLYTNRVEEIKRGKYF